MFLKSPLMWVSPSLIFGFYKLRRSGQLPYRTYLLVASGS